MEAALERINLSAPPLRETVSPNGASKPPAEVTPLGFQLMSVAVFHHKPRRCVSACSFWWPRHSPAAEGFQGWRLLGLQLVAPAMERIF